MNIFLCCLQSPNSYPIPSYKHWRENFKPPLEAMGHRVIEPEGLDFAVPFLHRSRPLWLRRYRAATSEELLRQVREAHAKEGIDLFFSYFYSLHVYPDVVTEIERLGIPTVNFFCDNLREFRSVSDLVNHFTLNWVPETDACGLYEQRGAPYIHLPMAANPSFYKTKYAAEIPQVTFIGSVDGLRTRLIANVLPSGLPLKVYGRGWAKNGRTSDEIGFRTCLKRTLQRRRKSFWQHWRRIRYHGFTAEFRHLANPDRSLGLELLQDFRDALHPGVPFKEMVHLGANSAVFLGINRCPHPGYSRDDPLVYSRLRDIEGPMMGACYLTEHCTDVEGLYDVGREIVSYRDADELISKASWLLSDDEARRKLRQRGRQATLSRHTWKHRFQALFQELGLPVETSVLSR